MARKPNLSVILPPPQSEGPPPPDGLDATGAGLWRDIVATWEWHDDPVIYRVVEEACYALQRAARCRRLIDEQGEVLRTKAGLRAHPLLKEETASRALGCRLLARLGTDLEPLHAGPGRPGGGLGVS
jgi:hypothetical protein